MKFALLIGTLKDISIGEGFDATHLLMVTPSALEEAFCFVVEEVPRSIVNGLFAALIHPNHALVDQFTILCVMRKNKPCAVSFIILRSPRISYIKIQSI